MIEIRKNKREENLPKKRREGLSKEKISPLRSRLRRDWFVICVKRNPPINEFEAVWALTNIASGTSENTKVIIDSGDVPLFIQLLCSNSAPIRKQTVLQAFPSLLTLITNTYKKSIKKETCWTISNITAGNFKQIQEVIQAGIIQPLIQLLQNGEFEIKKEAVWAISNATSGGNHDQIKEESRASREALPGEQAADFFSGFKLDVETLNQGRKRAASRERRSL
ncbi:unnamed protein product [Cochlearia groenlandica]